MHRHPLLTLHLSVLLFGGAGLFGKLVALPPDVIVTGRVAFASLVLAPVLAVRGQRLRPDRLRDLPGLMALGALLAAHWVIFFHSIQISSVAVGLLTYSTFPVFTAFLEPLLLRDERWSWRELGAALVALAGIALVVPELSWENSFTRGAFWGTLAGLTFAVLSIANRGYRRRYPALVLTFHQSLWATVALVPFLVGSAVRPSPVEVGLLALLGVVFTALAHGLFISGLHAVRARVASVIAALEPVYGIALAALLLGEIPGARTVGGGVIIVAAAAWVTLGGGKEATPPADPA